MTEHRGTEWSDDRLREMRTDVNRIEKEAASALRSIARLDGMRDIAEAQRDLIESQAQRITDLVAQVRRNQSALGELRTMTYEMQAEMLRRFDSVDGAHARTELRARGIDPDTAEQLPEPFRPDLRFWLKLAAGSATGVGVPIAIALLAGS